MLKVHLLNPIQRTYNALKYGSINLCLIFNKINNDYEYDYNSTLTTFFLELPISTMTLY